MRLHQLNFICNQIEKEYSVLAQFNLTKQPLQTIQENSESENMNLNLEAGSDSEDSVFSADIMSEDFNQQTQPKTQALTSLSSLQEILTIKGFLIFFLKLTIILTKLLFLNLY